MIIWSRNEAFRRIQSLRQSCGPTTHCVIGRDEAPRSGVSKTSRCEPAKTRPETKGYAFDFGPRFKRPSGLETLRAGLASQFIVCEALAHDLAAQITEPLRIIHRLPVVVAKCLLIQ